MLVLTLPFKHYLNSTGIILAVMSDTITSGIGYAMWYIALRGLSASQASVVQLSVPVIAALGSMVFVHEPITLRFILASSLILGGILLVTIARKIVPKQCMHFKNVRADTIIIFL